MLTDEVCDKNKKSRFLLILSPLLFSTKDNFYATVILNEIAIKKRCGKSNTLFIVFRLSNFLILSYARRITFFFLAKYRFRINPNLVRHRPGNSGACLHRNFVLFLAARCSTKNHYGSLSVCLHVRLCPFAFLPCTQKIVYLIHKQLISWIMLINIECLKYTYKQQQIG